MLRVLTAKLASESDSSEAFDENVSAGSNLHTTSRRFVTGIRALLDKAATQTPYRPRDHGFGGRNP